jgi:hypothetical protein
VLIPDSLPVLCPGDEVSIQLEAACKCPDVTPPSRIRWSANNLADGLALSADGLLSGTPTPGEHTLEVAATFDTSSAQTVRFDLEVLKYCTVAFATDEDADAPYVAAADIVSGETVWTAVAEAEGTATFAFEISTSGSHLVQILGSEDTVVLELFELQSSHATPQTLEYEGDYMKHAFSPDGVYLALVTTDPEAANGELLQLVDLERSPASVVDSSPVNYVSALTWSSPRRILFAGVASTPGPVAMEQEVVDGELGALLAISSVAGAFDHFIPKGEDFLAVTDEHSVYYYDRDQRVATGHSSLAGISPEIAWVAAIDTDRFYGIRIDPVDARSLENPYYIAADCEVVRAWSANGLRVLCTRGDQRVAYSTDSDERFLEPTWLEVADSVAWQAHRAAFSSSGEWLAFLPTRDGLTVTHEDEFSTAIDSPTLESNGAQNWDFFFTPREDYLVVQRATELFVAPLPELEFHDLPLSLGPVPECVPSWPLDGDEWCGAPQVAQSPRVAPTEAHLALSDAGREVHVVDLASREVTPVGFLSVSCEKRCIQFQ